MNRLLPDCRKPSRRLLDLGVVVLVWLACLAPGQIAPAAPDDDADSTAEAERIKAQRAVRLDLMRRRARSLVAQVKEADEVRPVELVETALLHYNNLAGKEFDATLWAWGKSGRPVAIATLAVHHGPSQIWNCEMVSLVNRAVTIVGPPGWKWTPANSGLGWNDVAKGPKAARTAAGRAVQMKDLAEQFTATGYYRNGNTIELRLMARPLHRYSDPDAGIVDGAVFAFAEGTNPEVLMLVECRDDGSGKQVWQYACARMSGGRLVTRLGDLTVWECRDVQGWFPDRPYTSINGEAEEVFGPDSE